MSTKSEQMSRVRSKNTLPELAVRQILSRAGVRYRLHRDDLPGKPDIYIPRLKLALLVNGCFWHGHDCSRGRRPGSNTEFWSKKLDQNLARDQRVLLGLANQGLDCHVLWTCQAKDFAPMLQIVIERYRAAV